MRGLKGKNVLVTGASTGIGRAIAIRFAQEGANVAVNYYSGEDEAQETQSRMAAAREAAGHTAEDMLIQADVSKEDQVETMFSKVLSHFGSLNVLINNAGVQFQAPSHEIELDKFDKMLDINLRGAYLCARKAIQHFLAQGSGGVIINDSSVHEVIPRPKYVGYTISKAGMKSMTQTLALEYARDGIRVNAIGPGATLTPINPWKDDPEEKSKIEENIPMGRAGTPEEMAAVTAFLASDDAAYITGQTLFVDGGLTLYPSFRTPWT